MRVRDARDSEPRHQLLSRKFLSASLLVQTQFVCLPDGPTHSEGLLRSRETTVRPIAAMPLHWFCKISQVQGTQVVAVGARQMREPQGAGCEV